MAIFDVLADAPGVEILEDERAAPITPTGRCGRAVFGDELEDVPFESAEFSAVLGRIFRGGGVVLASVLKRLLLAPSNTAC